MTMQTKRPRARMRTRTNNVHTVANSGRTFRLVAALWTAGVAALCCTPQPLLAATKKKTQPPIARVHVAEGQVINHEKTPIDGAVVYLENPKTLDVKSYLTDKNGHFHFSQITPQTDYEVWAEQNGEQSKHKFISQFSSHTHFIFTLKLDAKGKKKLGFL